MEQMLAVVEWSALMARMEGGSTVRAHLEAVVASHAGPSVEAAQRQLTPPPFPATLTYLWEWWLEVGAGRGESQVGIAPLTYRDLYAWAALTGVRPTAWEVSMLLAMDRTYRRHVVSPS